MAPKRKRTVLTIEKKLEIVKKLKAGASIRATAEEYGLGKSTVGDLKRDGDKLEKFASTFDEGVSASNRQTMKQAEDPGLDKALYMWFTQKSSEGVPISGPMLLVKAAQLNEKLGGKSTFKASNGYLHCFKQRHGIRQLNVEGEKLSADIEKGKVFTETLREFIQKEQLTAEQIYNCDETGLYWKALPTKTLAAASENSAPGRKQMKQRVTVLACANASGMHCLPLTVIGKSKRPRCFSKVNMKALPVNYLNQKNAWMDSVLFVKWFHDIFVPAVQKHQEKNNLNGALLLLDNAPAHPDDLCVGNIRCMFLPPNTTSTLQPMDQGVLECLKRRYRKLLLTELLFGDRDVDGVVNFWKTLTLKDCVYWIAEAWDFLPQRTVQRSWHKLAPYLNDSNSANEQPTEEVETISDFHELFAEIPGCENCDKENIAQWLESDANDPGFHLLTDDEIVAEVTDQPEVQPASDDESQDEMNEACVTNTEAELCLSKALLWLEQQSDSTTSEIMMLKRLRDTAARKRVSKLKQTTLTFHSK